MKLKISIVTPEKTVIDEEADEVIIPTAEGEIAVLPEHIPLLSQIAPGEVVIKNGGNTHYLVVMGGFLEISNNTITVLADFAIRAKDVNTAKAEEAKEHAQRVMHEKASGDEFNVAQKAFMRAILELKIAKRAGRISS